MHHPIKSQHLLLPHRSEPFSNEGPQGYLMRLARENLLSVKELHDLGIAYDYDTLVNRGLLRDERLDQVLHRSVRFNSALWQSESRVWNQRFARFCPHCLQEDGYWQLAWEINFYDVCHRHAVWMIDQCDSCGQKISWNRSDMFRCQCGSDLLAEKTREAPENLVNLSHILHSKIHSNENQTYPELLKSTNLEQTQRLIRYLGCYLSQVYGKKPLKIRNVGDLKHSWLITSLAAELIADWPNRFHLILTTIEQRHHTERRFSLNVVFGQAYHYVFKALKESAFAELRHQFELWINASWKGGVAKRNKRLTESLLKHATWIPASAACDFLGISHQRLELLIREGTVIGETHISEKGRKFVMVRRDNLEEVKPNLFGQIDMNTAGKLLGLQKRRMRMLLTLLFKDAKKLGASPKSIWSVSRIEVNALIDLGQDLNAVAIPDEGCVAMSHILQFWAWHNQVIAALICSVRSGEIKPINLLEDAVGIAAWIFREDELRHWKLKNTSGLGNWLTIPQTANLLGIKQQVAYELVKLGYLKTEVMPLQMKTGTMVKRSNIDLFQEQYVFATQIAEKVSRSPRKLINQLMNYGITPVSGPMADGARQVLYRRTKELEAALEEFEQSAQSSQIFELR